VNKILKVIGLTALFVAVGAGAGLGVRVLTKKPAAEPVALSVIGLGACGKWMGAIVVLSDGSLHPSGEITEEQAVALAKTLPKENNTIAMAPCVLPPGGTTT